MDAICCAMLIVAIPSVIMLVLGILGAIQEWLMRVMK